MKLIEFVNKYIKTKVDFDKAYGAQCVDLFRQYCNDVLQIPHTGAVEGAKDLFINYYALPKEQKYFDIIANVYDVKVGDVAVWGQTNNNKFGHVAIIVGMIENNFLVFEQDGFKQDGAKLSRRNRNNLLGYLRPKKSVGV